MFSLVDQFHAIRPGVQGAVVRIGCFAIAISMPTRETELINEIIDFYGPYPRAAWSELPDFVIELRYRGFGLLRRQVQAYLDGHVRYQAAAARMGLPMLESGLNWLVWTSTARFLLVHAAVLEREGAALVMPGPSGVGKSTLCAALVTRGWRLLSDEVAMIRPRDGLLQPYPRPISLKNESIEMIARMAPTRISADALMARSRARSPSCGRRRKRSLEPMSRRDHGSSCFQGTRRSPRSRSPRSRKRRRS
jgi:HprK-related kinase A